MNHCLVAFLRRIANPAGLDLEAMLYQVRTLTLASFHLCFSMHSDHLLMMFVLGGVGLCPVCSLMRNRVIQSHGLAGPTSVNFFTDWHVTSSLAQIDFSLQAKLQGIASCIGMLTNPECATATALHSMQHDLSLSIWSQPYVG